MGKRVTGITVERTLIVAPVADVQGCVTNQEDCCSPAGSGSGSGSGGILPTCGECVTTCDQCVDISTTWTLSFGDVVETILYYVCQPDDGNYCRFISLDLKWDFRFDYDTSLWLLTNLDDPLEDRRMWYIDGAAFNCLADNTLTAFDAGSEDAVISPITDCRPSGSQCPDGTNYQTCTVSNKTNTCTCLPNTLQFTGPIFSPCSGNGWSSLGNCEGLVLVTLCCVSGQWVCLVNSVAATQVSYTPGLIVFDAPLTPCATGPDGTFRLTFTA